MVNQYLKNGNRPSKKVLARLQKLDIMNVAFIAQPQPHNITLPMK